MASSFAAQLDYRTYSSELARSNSRSAIATMAGSDFSRPFIAG